MALSRCRLLASTVVLFFLTPLSTGASDASHIVRSSGGDLIAVRLARVEQAAARTGMRVSVLLAALRGYQEAVAEGVSRPGLLTVIDYSLPSRIKRLWVLDLKAGTVLAHELVAHGRGSGVADARTFSNLPGSLKSSLGVFVTGSTYEGKNGLSLRLRGIDAHLNDRAMERAIVVHGAPYVSDEFVRQFGRLGRSEGCPALSTEAAPRVIDLIRDGTVLFAYYPTPALMRSASHG